MLGSYARLVSFLFVALTGASPLAAQQSNSLYSRIGGYDVIAGVVDDFLVRFDADPELVPFLGGVNAAAGARIRQHFVDFLCARSGGPCLYNGRDMKDTHAGLPITRQHFDAVIRHFVAALEAKRVAERERTELLAMLESLRPEIVTR